MKKIIATLMALSLALALTACGGNEGETSSAPSAPSVPSTADPVSSEVSSVPSVEAPVSSEEEEDSLNLALKGTAIADGVREAGKEEPKMNDGNTLTLWQSADKGPETEEIESWFGIQWDEAQTFDSLFVLWEQAHPTENGFRVETSEDGETWTEIEFTSVRGGTPDETLTGGLATDKQTDTITLSEMITTKYIRIVCFTHYTMPDNHPTNAGETKSPTGVYEFEIYNSDDVEAAEGETSSEAASEVTSEETSAE